MKKIILSMFACMLVFLMLGACKKNNDDKVIVGISKLLQHPALDACEQGIQDAISDRGITVEYDLQNANNDLSTASQIANKFKSEKVKVAVGIATPAAQSLAKTLTKIPVVFTAVTDPVGSELVKTIEHGDGNVTGASDKIATADNITLFKQIADIKTMGYIYTPAEANSLTELASVRDGAAALGIELVEQTVNTTADVKQAAQSIVNRIDGIYLSTDNTVFGALPAIIDVFKNAKKPIFAGDASGAKNGGCMIASGSNYYRLGYSTGNIVADILEGKSPSDIPIKFATEPSELDLLIDLDAAELCNITIPQSIIDAATMIYQNGQLIER
ncbi:ABC transporter substrate-binding protein [Spirochaetia bacterium]|nr:ABC transporter substrate-binding protein [Spirochaetia bacterium]